MNDGRWVVKTERGRQGVDGVVVHVSGSPVSEEKDVVMVPETSEQDMAEMGRVSSE